MAMGSIEINQNETNCTYLSVWYLFFQREVHWRRFSLYFIWLYFIIFWSDANSNNKCTGDWHQCRLAAFFLFFSVLRWLYSPILTYARAHTTHTQRHTDKGLNESIDLIKKKKRVVYAIFFVFVFLIIFVSSRWIRKTHSQAARHWTKIIENICFLAKKFQWSVGDCLSATAVCFQGNKW